MRILPSPQTKDRVMRDYALHQAEQSGSLLGTGLLARYWHNWQARRAVKRLDELDDFLLGDIGVTRADINLALRAPLTENAVLVLDRISRR
jgi:uncharacterized protein YjiS (DUF1127 family)